ncbi:uncharacterized protein LOC117786955 [Drosophila innubila]|uniref:uncharacterized protein LOC117786955 n=1 Tax=Drosophila innubila TaxID=198719 RepID=UPI00148E46B4|nr:uncharacterized protein LOC117786955 [Drosophila innubila]
MEESFAFAFKLKAFNTTNGSHQEPFRTLLICLLAIGCLAEVSLAKHHKHKRHYEDSEEDPHYLPPAERESEPYYHKEKHTRERVTYHKDEEHEPKRVDHYHHYDKKPEVQTKHIHYQEVNPQVRTTAILPAASGIVTRRVRPNRVTYASAPNSVFHTQINVQSQDSELNSQIRPDPVIAVAPAGGQLAVNTPAPAGAQLPANALPNCQFPVAGNPPIGCRLLDPAGGQLPAGAFPPGGQLPANGLPLGGQLPADAFPPGGQLPAGGQLPTNAQPNGGQLPANAFPAGGQLPANGFPVGGQLPANVFPAGGQLLTNGFPAAGQLGNGAQLGVGLGNGNGNFNGLPQGFSNQNLFIPAGNTQLQVGPIGQVPVAQRPSSVLIQFDPAIGAQLPASAQANVGVNPNQLVPAFGAQLGNGQTPIGQQPAAPVSNQFGPIFGAQLGVGQVPNGQQPVAGNPNPFNPVLGGQLPTGAQAPTAGNQNPVLGGQLPTAAQAPNNGNQNPVFGGQLPTSAQVPNNGNLNLVTNGQRLISRRRNGRQRNRSNYQGLNVVNGNVFGQPNVQGPTNAVGNQQDTNIIDGNFYSYPGHQQHRLYRVNGNRRLVLTDGDYVDDYDTTADVGFAASSPELSYAVPEGRGSRRKSDHEAAASEQHTEYRKDDGYHYKNPRRTK